MDPMSMMMTMMGFKGKGKRRGADFDMGGDAKRAKGGGSGTNSSAMVPHPNASALIRDFATKWSLNEKAIECLTQLSPPALMEAMRSFGPKGEPHDGGWSGKFISFAKSLEMNLSQDPVAAL